jgi:hypothetical protein
MFRFTSKADIGTQPRDVRFRSKADIAAPPTNVRFTLKSGHFLIV